MRVLVIEDDKQIADYILKGLQERGNKVDVVSDGKQGLLKATGGTYDVLLVDRMLPSLDGLSIIRILRANDDNTPALIVSALDNVDERVRGIRSGSDDYLIKPFSFAELEARIDALVRRSKRAPKGVDFELRAGNLVLDILGQNVTRGGKRIQLQNREFRLLRCLLEHKGQVVTRTMLLEHVWDYHFDPQTNVIDVHISRLRRKIDEGFSTPIIKTVRGSGYLIED